MAANVGLWGVQQLSNYLQSKGISQSGIDSIKGNAITGEMFLELCEEDIKDAFGVFKDRFTIRKLLRELKSNINTPSASAPGVANRVDRSQQQIQHIDFTRQQRTSTVNNVEQNQNYRQSMNTLPPRNTIPTINSIQGAHTMQATNSIQATHTMQPTNAIQATHTIQARVQNDMTPHGLKRKWQQDTIKSEPSDCVSAESSRLQPRSSFSEQSMNSHATNISTSHPFSNVTVSEFSPPAKSISRNQAMNEDVSSSQDLRSKTSDMNRPYPVALTRVPNNAVDQKFPAASASNNKSCMNVMGEKMSSFTQQTPSITIEQSHSSGNIEKHEESVGDSSPFALSLVTSSISRFSVDELLGKKGVRGRPTEAQRLGTVLIRNAAQSIRIWDCPPLVKDIPDDKKEAFMTYIVSSAPQLRTHTELVWTRLREALQNRRKYLLDKETGRRCVKGSPQENKNIQPIHYNNMPSIKTEPKYNDNSDELIDLTF